MNKTGIVSGRRQPRFPELIQPLKKKKTELVGLEKASMPHWWQSTRTESANQLVSLRTYFITNDPKGGQPNKHSDIVPTPKTHAHRLIWLYVFSHLWPSLRAKRLAEIQHAWSFFSLISAVGGHLHTPMHLADHAKISWHSSNVYGHLKTWCHEPHKSTSASKNRSFNFSRY